MWGSPWAECETVLVVRMKASKPWDPGSSTAHCGTFSERRETRGEGEETRVRQARRDRERRELLRQLHAPSLSERPPRYIACQKQPVRSPPVTAGQLQNNNLQICDCLVEMVGLAGNNYAPKRGSLNRRQPAGILSQRL